MSFDAHTKVAFKFAHDKLNIECEAIKQLHVIALERSSTSRTKTTLAMVNVTLHSKTMY